MNACTQLVIGGNRYCISYLMGVAGVVKRKFLQMALIFSTQRIRHAAQSARIIKNSKISPLDLFTWQALFFSP